MFIIESHDQLPFIPQQAKHTTRNRIITQGGEAANDIFSDKHVNKIRFGQHKGM